MGGCVGVFKPVFAMYVVCQTPIDGVRVLPSPEGVAQYDVVVTSSGNSCVTIITAGSGFVDPQLLPPLTLSSIPMVTLPP
jgi:hypothetical protein